MPGTWGASTCPEGSLQGKDSIPSGATDIIKSVCFRSYADDVAGAADLVRELTTRRPKTYVELSRGDADRIAAAMYAEHYFTGHGASVGARIGRYAAGLASRALAIARALGEPVMVRRVIQMPGPRIEPGQFSPALPLAALLGLAVMGARVGGVMGAPVGGFGPRPNGRPPSNFRHARRRKAIPP